MKNLVWGGHWGGQKGSGEDGEDKKAKGRTSSPGEDSWYLWLSYVELSFVS